MAPKTDFPRIRACLFDMDGLLIDSEDKYTFCTNQILREHGRPPIPWSIKAQLQGRPGPAAGKIFHEWAKLPISREEYYEKQSKLQEQQFKHCQPLPGVEKLLKGLKSTKGDGKVHIAVATSSHSRNYEIKTERLKNLFNVFTLGHVVKGDDERIPTGRGKPLPDIYLLTLQLVNETMRAEGSGEPDIRPEECLVFEDSVQGIEAGRRAGMRVVWCPHPGLLQEYKGKEKEILAGRTGTHKEEYLDATVAEGLPGSPGHVGEVDDGWAEFLPTLEHFDYAKYGIQIPP